MDINDIYFSWKIGKEVYEERFVPFSEEEVRGINEEYIQSEDRYTIDKEPAQTNNTATDYICEAHTTSIMSKYKQWYERGEIQDYDYEVSGRENRESISKAVYNVLQYDLKMEMAIELARWDLSELNISYPETTDEENEKKENICNIIESVWRYLDSFREDELDEIYVEEVNRIQERIMVLNNQYEDEEIGTIFVNIGYWIEKLSTSAGAIPRERDLYIKEVEKLIEKVPGAMGEEYARRYKSLKEIWARYYKKEKARLHVIQMMSISTMQYENNKGEIIQFIVNEIQEVQNNTVVFDEIISNAYKEKMKKLSSFFVGQPNNDWDKKTVNKKKLDKYFKGPGCFALMHTSVNNYFAFSGKDDYESGMWTGKLCSSNEIRILANQINNNFFDGKYIWARMSDVTRRYTELLNTDEQIKLISGYVELGSDFGNFNITDTNTIGRTYGCCERKMQAANSHNFVEDKEFYARWAPCDKCIPALALEKGYTRIFAFAKDFHEWKGLDKPDMSKMVMQEYEITTGIRKI